VAELGKPRVEERLPAAGGDGIEAVVGEVGEDVFLL
jgi:hypothetical protein